MPSCGFVHCFPLGAMAAVSLALCINQLRPRRFVLQFQAHDQHSHCSICSSSDAEDRLLGLRSLPLLTCPSSQPALSTAHQRGTTRCHASVPKQQPIGTSLDDIYSSPTYTPTPGFDRQRLREGKRSPARPLQSTLALPNQTSTVRSHLFSAYADSDCGNRLPSPTQFIASSACIASIHHTLHHG